MLYIYFMLHTSYSMCMYIPSACFSGSVYSYIHLMSTTQLDRSRSPTMPCILLVYIYIYIYIYIYLYIYIYIYRKIAARCTTRLARSRSPITYGSSWHRYYSHGTVAIISMLVASLVNQTVFFRVYVSFLIGGRRKRWKNRLRQVFID